MGWKRWQQRAGKEPDQEETLIRDLRPRKPITGKARIQLAPEAAIFPTPCMDGDFIVKRPAVVHPGLARPTAFLGDVAGRSTAGVFTYTPYGRGDSEDVVAW